MSIVPDHPEEQEREHLYLDGARHYKHVPDLAYRWLEELIEQGGLPDISSVEIRSKGRPLLRPIREDPVNTPSDPSIYPARLDSGQVIWVRLDEKRSSNGYRSVSVVEKPNAIRAILALLTILEGTQTDVGKLRNILPFVDPSHPVSIHESQYEAFRELVEEENVDMARAFLADINDGRFDYRSLEYATALLRYFRPNFDSLPLQERRDLLAKCCERINKLLEVSRQLSEFLEYGSPDKDQRPTIENPRRDVEAAALRDVEGYTYREIAEFLDVEISEKSRCVGDYSTVAKMVDRGREVLRRAFGEDGWQDKAAAMKARLESYNSLTPQEQFIRDCADDWGVSRELASEIIVNGLDPDPEQAKSMARSGFNIEGARRVYDWIYKHSPPPHPQLARSEDPGWRDVVWPDTS